MDEDYDYLDMYEDDDCDHEDYDVDILIGRASCSRCNHSWWMSTDQMKEHFEFRAQYHEYEAEQHAIDPTTLGKEG